MLEPVVNSLTFKGRVSRLGYWRWQLALSVSSIIFGFVPVALLVAGAPRWLAMAVFSPMLVLLAVAIGVAARRLHDRGKGFFWLLLFGLAPFSFLAVALWSLTQTSEVWAYVALGLILTGFGLNIWGGIELGVLRGHTDRNRFGPPPDTI